MRCIRLLWGYQDYEEQERERNKVEDEHAAAERAAKTLLAAGPEAASRQLLSIKTQSAGLILQKMSPTYRAGAHV